MAARARPTCRRSRSPGRPGRGPLAPQPVSLGRWVPAAAVDLLLSGLRETLVASDLSAGCAVAAVTLDLRSGEDKLHGTVSASSAHWRQVLAAFAATEGVLILAPAERSAQSLDDIRTGPEPTCAPLLP